MPGEVGPAPGILPPPPHAGGHDYHDFPGITAAPAGSVGADRGLAGALGAAQQPRPAVRPSRARQRCRFASFLEGRERRRARPASTFRHDSVMPQRGAPATGIFSRKAYHPPACLGSSLTPYRHCRRRACSPNIESRVSARGPTSFSRKFSMATGTVKWFNESKGYGFITPDDKGEDLFAHFSAIKMDGFKTLKEGQRVSFEVTTGPKGKQASNIQAV
jgi:CspA family cold shock protein